MTLDPKLEDLSAMLRRAGEQEPRIRTEVHTDTAEATIAHASQDHVVPRDTGNLRDSQGPGRINDRRAEIRVTAEYALAVHETHPDKPRWMLYTIVTHTPEIMRRSLEERLRQAAERVRRGGGA